MGLIKLALPPGVYRNGTAYQSSGRYFDASLMRFFAKTIRPFGGWQKKINTPLEGPGRGMLAWRPTSFQRLVGIGTPNKLYVYDDSSVVDITPYEFPPGVVNTFYGVGYGFGPYGAGPYGVSAGAGATEATTWSLDTWGSHLVACASHDGTIYEYDLDSLPAEPVANAPSALTILVTAERILVAIGANGNRRLVAWSDQEDNTEWTADFDNQAGDKEIQTDGTLVTGRRVRGQNLLWTTTDLHSMRYIGQPFIYSFDQVSANCGLAAPLAVQVIEGGAVWMGWKNFFRFDGGQVKPIPCDLQDYVFSDINFDQVAKFSSGHIAAFGEVLFFYCSAGSTSIDRCVSWNYQENHWNIVDPSGLMARGCWADAGVFRFPLAVGEDGYLYEQESGWTAAGTPILTSRFLKSGPLELGNGDQIMEATTLIPDEKTAGQVRVRFAQQFTPEGPVYNRGPYIVRANGYTDVRLSARQLAMHLESVVDDDFRIGVLRLDAVAGGLR